MPFERPSLRTLVSRARAEIEAKLDGADARLPHSIENVLAAVLAGATHSLHGHIEFLSRQVVWDTAEREFLERWAGLFGIVRKDPAAAAGEVTFTGTNGTEIPAGTRLQRNDGVVFETQDDGEISGGTVTIEVVATSTGLDTNTEAGVKLRLTSPIAGVASNATVAEEGLTNGLDAEKDEALLERLQLRIQQPPSGGGPGDYVRWALEVAGVTRAWEFAQHTGPGTVGLTFVLDEQESSILPDVDKVAEVQEHIDALRPIGAAVTVFAPTEVAIDLTIELTPDTAAVRAAVAASIRDLFRLRVRPGGTVYVSHLREAISTAAGETDHVLTNPTTNTVLETGELPKLGTITWS